LPHLNKQNLKRKLPALKTGSFSFTDISYYLHFLAITSAA
jgi:hypothetical protein